jgi:hypothetical protein
MKQRKKQTIPLHPFLLAAASVVSLLSVNKTEVIMLAGTRLLLVMLLLTLICYFINLGIFRNSHKAGLITSVVVLLFTSYGQVYNLLSSTESLTFLARHRYLAGAHLVILAIAVVLIARLKKPAKLTWPANLIIGIALAIPLAQVVFYYAKDSLDAKAARDSKEPVAAAEQVDVQNLPDIYYIILDSYGREDALMNNYSFDNSDFIEELRARGFYVADCSRSNYAHTQLSLSSSLNMDYLDNLGITLGADSPDLLRLKPLIKNSDVRQRLAEMGYKFVTFESGYAFTEIQDADYKFKSGSVMLLSPYIEPFEYLYLENTAFLFVINTQTDFMDHYFSKLMFPFTDQVLRVQNVFEKLPTVPEIPGAKFVFVHLEIPHHPFIFLPDGSVNPDSRYYPGIYDPPMDLLEKGYINQVEYVNAEMLPIIDEILAKSKNPPIILIQGDHGLQVGERNLILNAYYLPDGGEDILYPSISPVNSFRVVFDEYFGADLPLLDDVSYYSNYKDKLNVSLIEEKMPTCAQ